MTDCLNVLYQFNEAYAPFAGTSLTSLLLNNKELSQIRVFVLGEQLTEQTKETMSDMIRKYNRSITFLNTDHIVKEMQDMGIPDYRGSYATNFKMFIPRFLGEEVDRIVYIDADTIIDSSLRPLLRLDMKGMPLAMAYDSLGKRHALLIGHKKSDPYFNAGVILFDLPRWREYRCTERIIEHVKNVRSHYMAPDQDLLNVVLKGQIAIMDSRYDFQPIHSTCTVKEYDILFRPNVYYSNEEMESAAADPVIYHFFRFLGEFPWHKNSIHPFKEKFDFYLTQSPWFAYTRQASEQNGVVFKIERWLYKYVPRSIFWVIFYFSYNMFIQKCWRDSSRGRNNENM